MTISLDLDAHQQQRLEDTARRLNVTVYDLAMAAITELLSKPDSDFEVASERVLRKNTELYKRLA